jgi:hypothetical protein
MKKIAFFLPIFFAIVTILSSCGSAAEPSVKEKLSRVWTANMVTWGSTSVYSSTSTSNTQAGYKSFSLTLTSANAATLTEFDGNSFTGTWALSTDEKTLTITFTGNAPTGLTNNQLSYSIANLTTSSVTLTTTQALIKASNSAVTLTLASK